MTLIAYATGCSSFEMELTWHGFMVTKGKGWGGGSITFTILCNPGDYLLLGYISGRPNHLRFYIKEYSLPPDSLLKPYPLMVLPRIDEGLLTVKADSIMQEITIHNSYGLLVERYTGLHVSEVNLNNVLPPGVYFIQASSVSGRSRMKRILLK